MNKITWSVFLSFSVHEGTVFQDGTDESAVSPTLHLFMQPQRCCCCLIVASRLLPVARCLLRAACRCMLSADCLQLAACHLPLAAIDAHVAIAVNTASSCATSAASVACRWCSSYSCCPCLLLVPVLVTCFCRLLLFPLLLLPVLV